MKQRKEALARVWKMLVKRKQEILQDLDTLANDKVSDGQVQDLGDEASSLTLERLNSSLGKSDIEELKLIDDAILRLENGEYGFCIDCGEHISSKRLETFPYAARCVVCQENVDE